MTRPLAWLRRWLPFTPERLPAAPAGETGTEYDLLQHLRRQRAEESPMPMDPKILRLAAAWVECEAAVPLEAVIRFGRTGARSNRGWVTVYSHGDHVHSQFGTDLEEALRETARHFREGTQGE